MAKAKWTQTKYPGVYKYELKSGIKYGIRVRYQDENLVWKEKSESGFPTISAARKKKNELETTINKDMSKSFKGENTTLDQWYQQYLKLRLPTWSPETRVKVESCYKNHLSHFKDIPLSKITLMNYQHFINKKLYEEDLSQTSVREYHRVLMSIINDAVTHELLIVNKLSKVKIIKEHVPKNKVLTREEIALFDELAMAELRPLHLAVYTLLKIGWRTGEILGLTKKAIDILPNGDVDLRVVVTRTRHAPNGKTPKNVSSYRTSRVSGDNAAIIIQAYSESKRIYSQNKLDWNNDSFIFINHLNSKPYYNGFVRDIINKLSKKLGIKAHPHMFRHSFASHAIADNHNVVEVSKWLGHKNVSMTLDNYSHSTGKGRNGLVDFANYVN